MNRMMWAGAAGAFRRTALPLASYYAVTLVLPLANGAAQSGAAFLDHALVVLVVPPVMIVLACAVHKTSHVFASASSPVPDVVSRPATVNHTLNTLRAPLIIKHRR